VEIRVQGNDLQGAFKKKKKEAQELKEISKWLVSQGGREGRNMKKKKKREEGEA